MKYVFSLFKNALSKTSVERNVSRLHYILAIVILFELFIQISDFLKTIFAYIFGSNHAIDYIIQYIPDFLQIHSMVWLIPTVNWILNISGLITVCLAIYLYTKARHLKKSLKIKISENEKLAEYEEKYKRCENIFKALAAQNAKRDADIFHHLYADKSYTIKADPAFRERITSIEKAITAATRSLEDALNAIAALFSEMTNDNCSACVQALRLPLDGDDILSGFVAPIFRDHKSASSRVMPQDIHLLKSNSLNQRIFIELEPIVIENNLKEKISNGEILTSSKAAGRDYNAVLLAPIPFVKHGEDRPRFSLCVDNATGFPEERRALFVHFAGEISWRISVLLYRLNHLGVEAELLKRSTNH